MAFLRKKGKYYHIVFTEQGERKEFSIRKTNKFEAEQVLNKFVKEAEQAQKYKDFVSVDYNKITLSEALQRFLIDRKRSKKISRATEQSYTNALNRFIGSIGDIDINDVDKTDEEKFLDDLYNADVSENTIANYTNHVRALFAWLIEKDYLNESKIPIKKKHFIYDRPTPIKPDHLKLIQNYLLDKYMIMQYDFVMATYFLALRKSETINMMYDNIDLTQERYYVDNTKGKRKEYIPILKDATDFFTKLKRKEEGKIFNYASDGGKKFWTTMMTELKLNYKFHNLRAARGTDLANAGAKPLFLQKFMRHQSLKTTLQHYVEVDEQIMTNHLNEILPQ